MFYYKNPTRVKTLKQCHHVKTYPIEFHSGSTRELSAGSDKRLTQAANQCLRPHGQDTCRRAQVSSLETGYREAKFFDAITKEYNSFMLHEWRSRRR